MLPIGGSGDFGSSPFFGQLTAQATGLLEFDYVACRTPKHNSRSRMNRRGHALICEALASSPDCHCAVHREPRSSGNRRGFGLERGVVGGAGPSSPMRRRKRKRPNYPGALPLRRRQPDAPRVRAPEKAPLNSKDLSRWAMPVVENMHGDFYISVYVVARSAIPRSCGGYAPPDRCSPFELHEFENCLAQPLLNAERAISGNQATLSR
jgi:hypothetical protein